MNKPVLLFDLDGTIIDSEPGILQCLKETLVEYEKEIPEDQVLREFIGPPIGKALQMMLGLSHDHEVQNAVTIYRKYYADHGVLDCCLYKGIRTLIEDLKTRGYRMFIVTSKARVYAELIVKHHELNQLFTGVYGPELTGTHLAKSESIAQLLTDYKLDSRDCLMIGDRENDITAANVHQMKTIGVLWGYGSQKELMEAGCHCFANEPAEILMMVEKTVRD